MKLSLAEPKYLKESIAIISELVNEAKFSITKEGIELIAMDPANVAMVIYKLFNTVFVDYELKENIDISIDLTMLKQILKRAKSSDMLTLELEDNRLKLQMKGNSTKTFYIPLLDTEEREQKVPGLTFPLSIVTKSAMLNEAIDDVDIVSESVAFIAEKDKFSVNAQGDTLKADIDVPADDQTKITLEGTEAIKSKYSIEYLKKIIVASKLADDVKIEFNKDYPMKLEFKDVDRLMLSFILAPRVDND